MWWHIGHELIVIVVMLSGCMVLVLGCEVVAGLSLVEALNSGQPGVPVCLARLRMVLTPICSCNCELC